MDVGIDFDRWQPLAELVDDVAEEVYAADGAAEKRLGKLLLKPLAKCRVEDLWLLVRHRVGLEFVVPLALEKLAEEPFLQSAEFPGDLLTVVLEAPETFWGPRVELWQVGCVVLEQAMACVEEARDEEMPLTELVGDGLAGAILYFMGIHSDKEGA